MSLALKEKGRIDLAVTVLGNDDLVVYKVGSAYGNKVNQKQNEVLQAIKGTFSWILRAVGLILVVALTPLLVWFGPKKYLTSIKELGVGLIYPSERESRVLAIELGIEYNETNKKRLDNLILEAEKNTNGQNDEQIYDFDFDQ